MSWGIVHRIPETSACQLPAGNFSIRPFPKVRMEQVKTSFKNTPYEPCIMQQWMADALRLGNPSLDVRLNPTSGSGNVPPEPVDMETPSPPLD